MNARSSIFLCHAPLCSFVDWVSCYVICVLCIKQTRIGLQSEVQRLSGELRAETGERSRAATDAAHRASLAEERCDSLTKDVSRWRLMYETKDNDMNKRIASLEAKLAHEIDMGNIARDIEAKAVQVRIVDNFFILILSYLIRIITTPTHHNIVK
jgi:hypothetical protein